MGTYDHEKLWRDWQFGDITVDMAIGHILQHLGLLYRAEAKVRHTQQSQTHEREHLQTTINALEKTVKKLNKTVEGSKATIRTLKRENEQLRGAVARLQTNIQALEGLNITVYQLKDEVDSLVNRLAKDSADSST